MNYNMLENILLKHPDVVEVCTIAVPKPCKEKEAKIFVVLKEKSKVTPEELMAYLKTQVNGRSEKIEVAIIDKLPKSPSGIVLRRKLVSLC